MHRRSPLPSDLPRHLPRPRRGRRPATRPAIEPLEGRLPLATLPPGFSEAVLADGLSSATAVELGADRTLYITEQSGTMEVWRDGVRLQPDFFRDAPLPRYDPASDTGLVDDRGERGLLGVTLDPDFASNRFVYVYYTRAVNPDGVAATPTTIRNRVSRFTANAAGDLALPGSERVLLELDDLSAATNHNGGALHFGPDGKLYVAVGDNARGTNAQALANRLGKILRINPDGSIPADNPFVGVAAGANRAIWALGLRNPFTFTFRPGTGTMFINDVGQNAVEEINVGAPGANYGWPGTEGDFDPAAFPHFTRPLSTYNHGVGPFEGFAITGGAFYDPANPGPDRFPTSFDGDYFFADFVNDWIHVLDPGTGAVSQFATDAPGAVDLRVGDDGGLYYLARDSGQVARIAFTTNRPPEITRQPRPATAATGGSATFDVAAIGGAPLGYQWQRAEAGTSDWSDIAGATGPSFTLHNASAADDGDRFRVVISNPLGTLTSDPATLTVSANRVPTPTIRIDSGLSGGRFVAGQPVAFTASADDPEDGALGPASLSWRVDYLSSIASGDPAVRPFVPESPGLASGTFTPATTGPYTLTDVAYRIVLTATDSDGAQATTTLDLAPATATLTVATSPAGLQVTVDGQPHAAPFSFESVVGFERPIGVAPNQAAGGRAYRFASWSDGGAATHDVATPPADTTYTATFREARLVPGDYDGDGLTDLASYRFDAARGTGVFEIRRSRDGGVQAIDLGGPGDVPVSGDFDGDGKADVAVVDPSTGGITTWVIRLSSAPADAPPRVVPFGASGALDRPAPADYDGDGITDIATFRANSDLVPGAAQWFILPSATDRGFSVAFGAAGGLDLPAPADYDGDGRADIATFRPSSDLHPGAADWFILPSSPNGPDYRTTAGGFNVTFGASGDADQPVPADYDGDGRADIATFRSESDLAAGRSHWFILPSAPNQPAYAAPLLGGLSRAFGPAGSLAAPGDYDGDGRPDLASLDPSSARWALRRGTDEPEQAVDFGTAGPGTVPVLSPLFVRLRALSSLVGLRRPGSPTSG